MDLQETAIVIYQDELYIASTTPEEILNILQAECKINLSPDFYLEGNYAHDPGGTMVSQLRKYLEKLYVSMLLIVLC